MARPVVLLLAALCVIACSVHAKRVMRIVNGLEYDVRVAPFMAQIKFLMKDGSYSTGCGGTIVDAVHIVTAAHCFKDMKDPISEVLVEVGSTLREQEGGRRYAVKSVVQHPKFKVGGFLNFKPYNQKFDVAVITLAEFLDFSDRVKPIAEIATTRVADNTILLTGGWGSIQEHPTGTSQDFGPQLKIAMVRKPTDEWCKKWFKGALISNVVNEAKDSLLCARPVDGTTCGGDSGSPLWIPKTETNSHSKLVGLVMGGETCVQKKAVPAFVDIADPEVQDFLRTSGVDL